MLGREAALPPRETWVVGACSPEAGSVSAQRRKLPHVANSSARTQTPFHIAFPLILRERGLSLRELGRRVDVDPSYLSRVRQGKKRVAADLVMRVAEALGLPTEYFPEAREALVIEAIRADPDLRERLFRRISRPDSSSSKR